MNPRIRGGRGSLRDIYVSVSMSQWRVYANACSCWNPVPLFSRLSEDSCSWLVCDLMCAVSICIGATCPKIDVSRWSCLCYIVIVARTWDYIYYYNYHVGLVITLNTYSFYVWSRLSYSFMFYITLSPTYSYVLCYPNSYTFRLAYITTLSLYFISILITIWTTSVYIIYVVVHACAKSAIGSDGYRSLLFAWFG